MTTRTAPEWPAGKWEFPEPITLYEYSICGETVIDFMGKSGSVRFGPHARNERSVCVWMTDTGRGQASCSIERTWPEWAWMVIVRGLHPLNRKEIVEHAHGATIHSGQERMEIEDFEAWLARERLELLVDFRASSIAEGWRPPYGGAGCEPPSLPPLHLAHWYPERTVLTCSPTREGGDHPLVKILQERYEQAWERRREKLRAKAANDFPIDDDAWVKELETRKQRERDRQAALNGRCFVPIKL